MRTRDEDEMCDAIGGGATRPMPPGGTPAPATVHGGGHTPPAAPGAPAPSGVGGQAGEGAALLGKIPNLAQVLTALVDALRALVAAIGGISGGGHGAPPPGKLPHDHHPAPAGFRKP
jgi:hypothetical protein